MKKQNKRILTNRSITIVLVVIISIMTTFLLLHQKQPKKKQIIAKEETQEVSPKIKDETPQAPTFEKEDSKTVYMTFDDGPTSSTTELLDALDEANIKATFFVTAQFLNESNLIESIKDIDKRGHTIGVHTYSHKYKDIYSSKQAFFEDYDKMDNIIYRATGKKSKVMRFPGGSNTGYNEQIRTELIQELNKRGVIYYDWNAYDGDNDGYEGHSLIQRAVQESSYTDKSILLMHDTPNKGSVITGVPTIVSELQSLGYMFKPLNETVEPIQFIQSN